MKPPTEVSKLLGAHYAQTFAQHGPKPEGVDWGSRSDLHRLRLEKMLAVLSEPPGECPPSLLDVGCGYGSLWQLIRERGQPLHYTGIDVCEPMVQYARHLNPDAHWIVGDFMDLESNKKFDYVVCNGILTQKLGIPVPEMDDFLRQLVTKMFKQCRVGAAFNLMTTHVNFTAPNLYYKNPLEIVDWCMNELTKKIRLDHSYPLFEFTVYLYKNSNTPADSEGRQ